MKRTRKIKCGAKKQYDSMNLARLAMVRFYASKFDGAMSPNASAYPCGDHFHWGHSRDRKR